MDKEQIKAVRKLQRKQLKLLGSLTKSQNCEKIFNLIF